VRRIGPGAGILQFSARFPCWIGTAVRTALSICVLFDGVNASVAAEPALATGDPALASEPVSPAIPLSDWRAPPHWARPIARWWWPGGSVDPEVIEQQIRLMAAAGFGGIELQPLLLGIGEDDLAADPRLRTVGEPSFHRSVAHAAAAAVEHNLEFDLTLGSGWPGGLPTAKKNAEQQLLMATLNLVGPANYRGPLPLAPDQSYRRSVEWVLDVLGPQDSDEKLIAVLAARVIGERDSVPILADVQIITGHVDGGQLSWRVPEGSWRVLAFYRNSTGHFVMGGAFPGAEHDALVVDHLSTSGAEALISGYGRPVIEAAGAGHIKGVFVDSFELMGELPITADFLKTFESLKGYSLIPYLPYVFRRGGESKYGEMMDLFGRNGGPIFDLPDAGEGERVREDYEAVRTHLFETQFVETFAHFAKEMGLAFRMQAHGGYGDYLDTYALADIPESEGLFGGGTFDFLKLASSAAHVTGRTWATSESFITLRPWGNRLSPEEMQLLAGRAYAAGINRLVYHGVPYPYLRADGKTWFPFSGGFGRILAGPLPMSSKIDEVALEQLPEFNLYLSRLSVAMSQGEPSADLAWLRADPVYPDTASLQIGRIGPLDGESEVSRSLRGSGVVYDRVSRKMLAHARVLATHDIDRTARVSPTIAIGAARYASVLLDPFDVAEPELVERLADLAEAGVPVFALGALPRRSPGLAKHKVRDQRVRSAVARLRPHVNQVGPDQPLDGLLRKAAPPPVLGPANGERLVISIHRRRTADAELVLLFNESWSSSVTQLIFNLPVEDLVQWNPKTGGVAEERSKVGQGETLALSLAPAEIAIFSFRPGRPVLSSTGTASSR
jgi:hypothetical protein